MNTVHAVILTLMIALAGSLMAGEKRLFNPEFYAFANGVSSSAPEDEAEALKALGYSGISQVTKGGNDLARRLAAYDKVGLKVLSIYLDVGDKPIEPDVVRPLAGRGAMIELTVRKMTPNTVRTVRQTADMAAGMNIRVALYPHYGFSIATMPQALDLIAKVDHSNLGVMFNLCHFLKSEKAEDLESILETAKPHLFAVSTSGADLGGKTWKQLIKTLDQGTFPQERLFRALKLQGFSGPVSLQCYGIKGDKQMNLRRSMEAWRLLSEAF